MLFVFLDFVCKLNIDLKILKLRSVLAYYNLNASAFDSKKHANGNPN